MPFDQRPALIKDCASRQAPAKDVELEGPGQPHALDAEYAATVDALIPAVGAEVGVDLTRYQVFASPG